VQGKSRLADSRVADEGHDARIGNEPTYRLRFRGAANESRRLRRKIIPPARYAVRLGASRSASSMAFPLLARLARILSTIRPRVAGAIPPLPVGGLT